MREQKVFPPRHLQPSGDSALEASEQKASYFNLEKLLPLNDFLLWEKFVLSFSLLRI